MVTDRTRALFASGAGIVVAALLATGCGVPSSGPPVTVATPPPPGVAENQPNDPTSQKPAPPPGEGPQQTVSLYFHAAAADETRNAEEQVHSFLTPQARVKWRRSDTPIPVVRLSVGAGTTTGTSARVPVNVQVVGELTPSGSVEPARDDTPFSWTFNLVRVESSTGEIWQISNPLEGMWLSTEAMQERYYLWPVYFARQRQTLVPDLRYVPKTLTTDKSRSRLVTWLLDGPSAWLQGRVESEIPAGTALRGLVVVEGGRVVVDLTAAADGVDRVGIDVLSAQLAWTLRPVMTVTGTLEVRVEGRTRTVRSRDSHDRHNAILSLGEQRRYVVAGGKAQPLSTPSSAADTPDRQSPVPLLETPDNTGVVFAGIADGDSAAALVRRGETADGTATMGLWLGQAGKEPIRYLPVPALASQKFVSRPSWSGSAWYVAADGQVFQVSRQNLTAQPVSLARAGKVTAVSVAPDGARIALVIDNKAYVGPLSNGPSPTIGLLRRVGRAVASVTDVAWSAEDRVVVAGHSNRSDGVEGDLWEVSIDDVLARQLAVGREAPTYIAVRPVSGWFHSTSSPPSVLYGVNGLVYEAFSARVDQVGAGHAPFYSS